jgi:acyl-CoA dehydrogenase family protein 10
MDNLIYNSNENTVQAVLDWELSTLGDSLSDVAYNSLAYHLNTSNPFLTGLSGLDLKLLGKDN